MDRKTCPFVTFQVSFDHFSGVTEQNAGGRADGATGDIVKYSTLSVDAAEFVPKSFSPAPPVNYVDRFLICV